jgi:hypothetical protein
VTATPRETIAREILLAVLDRAIADPSLEPVGRIPAANVRAALADRTLVVIQPDQLAEQIQAALALNLEAALRTRPDLVNPYELARAVVALLKEAP